MIVTNDINLVKTYLKKDYEVGQLFAKKDSLGKYVYYSEDQNLFTVSKKSFT